MSAMCLTNHSHLLPAHASQRSIAAGPPAADDAMRAEQRRHIIDVIAEAERSRSRMTGTALRPLATPITTPEGHGHA